MGEEVMLGYWPNSRHVPVGPCSPEEPCRAAVDSGSPTMSGPPDQVAWLTRTLNVSVDCTNFDQLPSVFFRMRSDKKDADPLDVEVTPHEYVARNPTGCINLFQPLRLGEDFLPQWLIGQPLLHRNYAVFDAANKRVGFALAARPPRKEPAAGSPKTCVDDDVEMAAWNLPGCSAFAAQGYCQRYKRMAAKNCPGSCGLCPGSPTAVVKDPGFNV